jgi:hypothetical protein
LIGLRSKGRPEARASPRSVAGDRKRDE